MIREKRKIQKSLLVFVFTECDSKHANAKHSGILCNINPISSPEKIFSDECDSTKGYASKKACIPNPNKI